MGETPPPPGRGGGTLGRRDREVRGKEGTLPSSSSVGGPRGGGPFRPPGRGSPTGPRGYPPTPGKGVVGHHVRGPSTPLTPPCSTSSRPPPRGGSRVPRDARDPPLAARGHPPSLERSTSIARRRTTSFVERRRRRRRTRSTSIAYDERRRSSCDVDVDVTRTIASIVRRRSTSIVVRHRRRCRSPSMSMATTIDVDRW